MRSARSTTRRVRKALRAREVTGDWRLGCIAILLITAPLAQAVVISEDEGRDLQLLVRSDPTLQPTVDLEPVDLAFSLMDEPARFAWSDFVGRRDNPENWTAQIDRRSGLVHIAEGEGVPWIPGLGNSLRPRDIASHLRANPNPTSRPWRVSPAPF